MGWATAYIQKLLNGESVQFRPRGNSMVGRISSGQLCTLVPISSENVKDLEKGDIVLCKVHGNQYLHIISAISGDQFQISNNKGFVNGWTTAKQLYGKCVKVED